MRSEISVGAGEGQVPQKSADNRLGQYGARPTVYAPRDSSPRRPTTSRSKAVVRVIRATVGVLLFLVGVPALLWISGGDPVRRLPTWPQVADWFNQSSGRFTPALLTGAAIWGLWLLWGAFALLLVAELLAALTRWRIPALRLPAPMHRLVFGLAGTAAIAVTSVGRLDAAAGDVSPAVVESTGGTIPLQAVARGPVTIRVADTSYLYTVERHDTLSKVAKDWLGDADRWPEICRLNKHRHWPGVGGTLRDCDLIYPGWELRLPSDARPPSAARAAPPSQRPDRDPDARPAESPRPSPTVTTPDESRTASPEPSATTGGSTVRPGRTGPDHDPAGTDGGRSSAADDGVRLPGGAFLPWALAAAISAAAALVWLQRRRRYIPGAHTREPVDLPTPVKEISRQVLRRTDLPPVDDLAERAADVPELPLLPPRGVGVVGGGACAAARAALTTMLAAGGPRYADQRGVVVIDRPTLAALFGPDSTHLEPWDRLRVVDDVNAALAAVETQLLHRARIRDERGVALAATVDQVPADSSPAPMLLLIAAPPEDVRNRTRVVLDLGAELGITALLLGAWPHGATIDVSADGITRTVAGQPDDFFGERAALLDRDSAVAILQTLREAHTGEPPSEATTDTPSADAPSQPADSEAEPVDDPAQRRPPAVVVEMPHQVARLRVLGPPRVEHVTLPGRPLRSKAAELAVYLACHPDGADTATIAEYLVPDARLRAARQQVHTNVSNLRHVLARAGGPRPGGYVLKGGANDRYRLDPTAVDVDLWRLRDLLRHAPLASGPARIELLREACALYTAPLADGCDYEWIDPHREKARRWGVKAHALLADEVLPTDPRAASDLLDQAIRIDRYNEELYRTAIRARHALGDSDGVHALLRALSTALADLDAQPSEATVNLVQELRVSLEHP